MGKLLVIIPGNSLSGWFNVWFWTSSCHSKGSLQHINCGNKLSSSVAFGDIAQLWYSVLVTQILTKFLKTRILCINNTDSDRVSKNQNTLKLLGMLSLLIRITDHKIITFQVLSSLQSSLEAPELFHKILTGHELYLNHFSAAFSMFDNWYSDTCILQQESEASPHKLHSDFLSH